VIFLHNIKFKFDIISLTETWLNDNINSDSLSIDGYGLFRTDRKDSYGGIACYVKDSFNCKKLNICNNFNSETMWLSIGNLVIRDVFCVAYRPPSFNLQNFTQDLEYQIDQINQTFTNCNLWISGDFNVNLFLGDNGEKVDGDFVNMMLSYGLQPLINKSVTRYNDLTGNDTLIDNIYSSKLPVEGHSGTINAVIADHLPIFSMIINKVDKVTGMSPDTTERKTINYEAIKTSLSSIDWDILRFNDVNGQYGYFFEKLKELIEVHTTTNTNKRRHRLPLSPWITYDIINLIKERDIFYKKTRKNRTNTDYQAHLKSLTNVIKKKCKKAKIDYVRNKFKLVGGNAKKTWNLINEIVNDLRPTSRIPNLPSTIIHNNESITNKNDMVETFNDYFVNITKSLNINNLGGNPPNDLISVSSICYKPFPDLEVTIYEIENIIFELPNKKSVGYDNIDTALIKKISSQIAVPLMIIANKMLKDGVFPDQLKIAKVIVLFKKGNSNACENYRPISLLSIFDKIFEKIIYKRLLIYIQSNNILMPNQYGFRPNSNTDMAALEAVEFIRRSVEDSKVVCGVFLDVAKAFDSIDYSMLIDKLRKIGLKDNILGLFKSYITNRKQFVSSDGFNSNLLNTISGVPQGSLLGPILFNIFINDIGTLRLKSRLTYFADDGLMLSADTSVSNLFDSVNLDLAVVSQWYKDNKLVLNSNKCNFIIFCPRQKKRFIDLIIANFGYGLTLDAQKLNRIYSTTYLGIIISYDLSWQLHVNNICKKTSIHLGILGKLRHYLPRNILIQYYYANVQSYLIYGVIIWGPTYPDTVNTLEVIINKSIRLICFRDYRDNVDDLRKSLCISTFRNLWLRMTGVHMYKIINNIVHNSNSFNISYRNMDTNVRLRSENDDNTCLVRLCNISYKTNYMRYSFINTGTSLWNYVINRFDVGHMSTQHMKCLMKANDFSDFSL